MTKAALFDLDGVIADTAAYHLQAWHKLVQDHFGLDAPADLLAQTKGLSRTDSLAAILSGLDLTVTDDEFTQLAAEKNALYQQLLANLNEDSILPGIADLLAALRKKGFRLALASASHNAPLILDKLGLSGTFDAIADPRKVAHGKPAPDIFLAAAKGVGCQPEDCIAFEDSAAGIAAIKAAGSCAVGVGQQAARQADIGFPDTAALDLDQILAQINRKKSAG
ncbi:beta-phosphoglucomutase [uncultured Lactobacillus sp.]|uniref:beta-phosphoglucomutase n=1 Tax=uncultured Lactobacillus sp. TaxID=153152 RepID=UPI002665F9C0|nr:beta-phosphoglucomutase [uncultured Lactobacillus sp.]